MKTISLDRATPRPCVQYVRPADVPQHPRDLETLLAVHRLECAAGDEETMQDVNLVASRLRVSQRLNFGHPLAEESGLFLIPHIEAPAPVEVPPLFSNERGAA